MKPSVSSIVYHANSRRAAARHVALLAELRSARPDLRRFARDRATAYCTVAQHAARMGWARMYVSAEERAHIMVRRATAPAPLEPYIVATGRSAAGDCPPEVTRLFAVVAAHYGVTVERLTAFGHYRVLTEPRIVSCALAVRLLRVQPHHCALWLGRRTYSGRAYLKTFGDWHDVDKAFRARVAAIQAALAASAVSAAA
jgi:hypothetical protein